MKKFTCYFIVLVISIFSLNITTFADYNTLNTRQLPSNAIMQLVAENENMGEIKEFHNLFNANHQISAYCIDYENGYIIYDNDAVLEFSKEHSSPFLNKDNCFYFGPLNYYIESDTGFISLITSSTLKKNEAVELSNSFETKKAKLDKESVEANICNASSHLANNTRAGNIVNNVQLQYSTILTSGWNSDNTCGSVALTIMMYYYHQHISGYSLYSNYSSNPYNLYMYLKTWIEPDSSNPGYIGSTGYTLKNGYNNYGVNTVNVGNKHAYYDNADVMSWGFVYFQISQGEPGVLLLQSHPIYGNHWVVTIGVYQIMAGDGDHINYYRINDGWGNNSVVVPETWVDSYVYLD